VTSRSLSWPWPAPAASSRVLRGRRGRHPVRVLYQDTDQARVVHHAAYFRYLEGARLELWREHGFDYAKFERETGFGLPVAEARVRYRSSACFDDQLEVETWTSAASRASVWIDAAIRRGKEVLVESSVRLACVSLRDGTIRRIPDALLEACIEV
jgi:acyl-CoA thioester hydrolase